MIINYLVIVIALIMTAFNIRTYISKKMPKDSRTSEAIVNEVIAALLVAIVDCYRFVPIISWVLGAVILALLPVVYGLHQKNKVVLIKKSMKYQLKPNGSKTDDYNFTQLVRGMQLYYSLLKVLSDSYDKETKHQLEKVKAVIRVKFLDISEANRKIIKKGKVVQYLLHAHIPKSQIDAKKQKRLMRRIMQESIRN